MAGCITGGDESKYRIAIDNFVTWSKRNYLQLYVTKAKELLVDLRRTKGCFILLRQSSAVATS